MNSYDQSTEKVPDFPRNGLSHDVAPVELTEGDPRRNSL